MIKLSDLEEFYSGRRVLLTGDTGFKGSWMALLLSMLGAEVYGYALEPPTEPALFNILDLPHTIASCTGDVRDFSRMKEAFRQAEPEIVFHLAAQPIVRTSYELPRETYETNVMGTVNLLECVRLNMSSDHPTVKSVLNVTTDKVYENLDLKDHAFKEDEKLDGYDPYSNSKSCSELVTHSYRKSFFDLSDNASAPAISTARAGNVIGGGDFARDRIIPDCVRDTIAGKSIHVRNPYSTRPYQHVLEPIAVYLEIAMEQAKEPSKAGYYNVGPDREDAVTTGVLADLFVKAWGAPASWHTEMEKDAPHEAGYLRLDNSRLKEAFAWEPRWHMADAIDASVKWYKAWHEGQDMRAFTEQQILEYLK